MDDTTVSKCGEYSESIQSQQSHPGSRRCHFSPLDSNKYNAGETLFFIAVAIVTEMLIYIHLLEITRAGFMGHQAVFFFFPFFFLSFKFLWHSPFNHRTEAHVSLVVEPCWFVLQRDADPFTSGKAVSVINPDPWAPGGWQRRGQLPHWDQ